MKTHSGLDSPKGAEKADLRRDAKPAPSRASVAPDKKEAFEPGSTEAVKPVAAAALPPAAAQSVVEPAAKKTEEPKPIPLAKEKSVVDVLKEAYNSKIIGKDEYDHALYKLLHKEVSGDEEPVEFKIFKNDGKVEMIVERGEIDIPTNSHLAVRKEGDHLIIKSDGFGEKTQEGSAGFGGGAPAPLPAQGADTSSADVFTTEELETIEKEFQSRGTTGELVVKNETSTLKEDLELIDLRREFASAEDEKKEAAEPKEAEAPGLLDGILDKVSHLTKKLKEESREEKLRRLSMANLGKIKELKEERRAIIGVAYVLKQFLQVRYNIAREVTYHELVDELKGKEMDRELKEQLTDFFRKMPAMMYAKVPLNESLPRSYNLAERVIKELSNA
jgi:hypothetical protein